MTNLNLANMIPEQRHIESLRRHGAKILGSDGSRTELNSSFVENAISDCIRMNCLAMAFDLFLPDIDEPMMIAIWKDGHIDSGSAETIRNCLESR